MPPASVPRSVASAPSGMTRSRRLNPLILTACYSRSPESGRIVMLKRTFAVFAVMVAFPFAVSANANQRTVCVFDIIGTAGDQYNIMRDYATAAVGQGYRLDLKVYTDENIAAEDLKANQCDAAVLTGIRGRQFNTFSGSL